MSNDPFASATTGTAATDPFGQKPSEIKTSDFPSMEDLDKKLIVVQPTKLEMVADKFNEGKTKERVSADVTVIDPDNPEASKTLKDMYISQGAMVGQIKGLIETRDMLLGKVRRFPAKNSPDETPISKTPINDPDSTDLLLQEWLQAGAKGNKPSFAWKLQDFTDQDKDLAMKWYQSKGR